MDSEFFAAFALVFVCVGAISFIVKRKASKKEGGGRKGEDKEQL
jgi:hypothetical protein